MEEIHTQKEIIFIWSVKNFTFCSQESCQYLPSPILFTKNFFNISWRLFLYPKGSADSKSDHVACDLSLSWPDIASDCLPIRVELGIVDANGLNKKCFATETNQIWRESMFRHSNFISRKELFHERDNYLPNNTLTIYCHAWRHANSASLVRRYIARTIIEIDRCFFRFDLRNFILWKTDHTLHIPVPLQSKFEIVIKLKKMADKNEYITIEINQLQSEKNSRFLDCTLSIRSKDGIAREVCTFEHLFKSNARSSFTQFISKAKVIRDKQFLLADETLTLQCEFAISSGQPLNLPIYVCEVSRKVTVNPILIDTLKDDLKRMLTEKKFPDVVLKAGGESFDAHKAMLSVRSPVFQAMFEQDMIENLNGTVDISDLDANTLHNLLLYMYSGTLEDFDVKNISKLLVAADKYQVLGLREKCVLTLKSNLSVQTVCQVLALAEFQEDRDLKMAALDFIFTNRREVLQSTEWICFIENNRKLSSEVLQKLSVQI
ncbi:speckle-type POZ protein B [Parasteatoda tepidariorum]|uniref:speckle-type POZ protein B n=1 Tax=Parasteatoda tepidariorum TaxID=114398 RepID=UPI001C728065|nr:speckle-type POZ protein-like B [Parasteatoda tepidariorum]